MKVRLKTNMLLDGKFIPIGSEMDREQLPERLRRRRYIEALPDDNTPHTLMPPMPPPREDAF